MEGEVLRVSRPSAGPGEVLVDVASAGICGSDLHALRGDPGFEWLEPPVVMGHEFGGRVAELGEGVTGLSVGDAVVAMSIQGCLTCEICRMGTTQLCADRRIVGLSYNGGLAESCVVPAGHLVRVPDEVPIVQAAIAEPLSVAVRAVLRRDLVRPGERVVVSGPGPIGLLSARLAQLAGGRVCLVGGPSDRARRLPIAEAWDIETTTVDGPSPETVLGGAPDAWIEASGAAPALGAAIDQVRRGGVVSVVALYADALSFFATSAVRRELTISCSYASAHGDYVRALELLASGAVDPTQMIDQFPLQQARRAFDAAYAGTVVKPLIVPSGDWPAPGHGRPDRGS